MTVKIDDISSHFVRCTSYPRQCLIVRYTCIYQFQELINSICLGSGEWEKLSLKGDCPSYLEGHTLVSHKVGQGVVT